MEYTTLGKTGLRVSRMGFGGIPIQKVDAAVTRKLMERLVEHGVDAQLVLVDGAEHEYDFWSQQVFDVIFDFIRERS